MIKVLCIVGLLLLAPFVCAEDYYWNAGYPTTEDKYSSVKAACQPFFAHWSHLPPHGEKPQSVDYFPNWSRHVCQYYYKDPKEQWGYNFKETAVHRYGDSCPSGKTLNFKKGLCEIEGLKTPEQCAAQQGEIAFTLDYVDTTTNTCILGCHANSPLQICGNGACSKTDVIYTGAYCDGEDHDTPPGEPAAPEPPEPSPPDSGNTDNTNGSGSSGGDSNSGNAGNGGGSGGSNNGNGSGNGSGNNPGNNPGSGSNNGSGNTGGGGKGGNGKDTCKPGEDCNGSKVSGEPCDVALLCEGDAIQCAILKQQKQQFCAWQRDAEKEANLKSDLESLVDGEKAAFEGNSTEIPVSHLFNDAINASRWLPAVCPAPKAMQVFGKSIYLSFEPLCKLAEWIAPLVVLLASLFFAITTAKAIKGN